MYKAFCLCLVMDLFGILNCLDVCPYAAPSEFLSLKCVICFHESVSFV